MVSHPKRIATAAVAALITLGAVGCAQRNEAPDVALSIVPLMPVDQNGAEVRQETGGTAVAPAGDGRATCVPVSIAMIGPLTGPDTPFGTNVRDGAQLAVDQHNSANPGCQVQLKTFDSEGDAQKATGIAPQIVNDDSVIGLVGPTWSGETKATGSTFDQAGLVAITPSATNVELSQRGWKTFFRGLSSDGVQGPSLANYMKNALGVKKVCVISDGTDAGQGQTRTIAATLGPIADANCNITIRKGDKDFSAAVTQIVRVAPDAVAFAAYYTEGALLIEQLRQAGFAGGFFAPDGLKDPEFVKAAGQSAKDAVISCPCGPATGAFVDTYTKKFGQAPGTYSVEAYDAATILLRGIDSGAVTRPALRDFVAGYDGQGLARRYQWTDTGELTSNLIWIYKVQ